MNLINDAWLPIFDSDGKKNRCHLWQIIRRENKVLDLSETRPDFRGALYQFLIGLLQTTFAPSDEDEWYTYWENPPEPETLKNAFTKIAPAFNVLQENDVAFLQDFDLPEGEKKPISALLIEAPGGKTLKDNLDHFVKGGVADSMCEACAATALFTLQTNAPSGGVGHRVGVRGGGPLTTLLMPENDQESLWRKLWLNVLPQDELTPNDKQEQADILPWMGKTRSSGKKEDITTPDDTHPLQMYWGMPRRIRFESALEHGECRMCGDNSESLISAFRTKNYGVNYDGPWVHPLTPYRYDPKKKSPPLSTKGQEGGLGFRHWLGLAWGDDANGEKAARVTQFFNQTRYFTLDDNDQALIPRLWCFGYDMDNMKARCWYEYQTPLVHIDEEYRVTFFDFITHLIATSKDIVKELRSQFKSAWFGRPKDAKGDLSFIDRSFWQATEAKFYQHLNSLAHLPPSTRCLPDGIAKEWLSLLQYTAYNIFDEWMLEADSEDLNMERIMASRRMLGKKFNTLKSIKSLKNLANAKEEV